MKIAINNEWNKKKYIYLDWNVVLYMYNQRDSKSILDTAMRDLVRTLKERKKFIFPFSEAHIQDRARKFQEALREEVKGQFYYAESVNEKYILVPGRSIKKDTDLEMCKASMMECFDDFLERRRQDEQALTKFTATDFSSFTVDVSKIPPDHPLHIFLQKHSGVVTSSSLSSFVENLFPYIFDDGNAYRNFRNYITKIKVEEIKKQTLPPDTKLLIDQLLYYMAPMLESKDFKEDELADNWRKICESWFQMQHKCLTNEILLKQGYVLLDLHPLFHDKIKNNKNTADNIIRDGNHCFYASKAEYFVSEDEKTRKKTKLMYKAFGIKTKVVSISEFVNKFDIMKRR